MPDGLLEPAQFVEPIVARPFDREELAVVLVVLRQQTLLPVRGRFDGELTARDQLIIHATGRVSGKIRYGKIKIEEGAEITGDIARTDRNDTRPLRAAQPVLKSAP